jgi:hypothetical protein
MVDMAHEEFSDVLPGESLGYSQAIAYTLGKLGLEPEDYLALDRAHTARTK